MTFKTLLAAAGATVAVALTGPVAHAADYKDEYKVSTVLPAPFPWGIAADEWVRLVAERTDGRINMKVYSGTQLVAGEQTKEFNAMRRGAIDMAVGSTINWSPQIVEMNLFAMPFLLPDYAALDALTNGPVGDRLFEIIRENGVEPLAWAENGFREVTNSQHPIETPADLEGLKMRVVGSPLFNDTFTALGANPVQMSWADAKPALTTGAVDGQENPLTVYSVAKMHEIGQQYITTWHYVADPLIFAVSDKAWGDFTPEDQEILRQAAIDAGRAGIEAARAGLTDEDDSMIQEIKGHGVTVTRLTEEQRQAFVEATRDVYDAWKAKIGPDLVEMAEESIANR
ncbi:DctP family TRAP transporter solute-binding subunit [Roseospira marina]|uniref:DctP family TRAP transporter solute-binding subunit n=1 Tax=Roseospira marina TaxID=140057 RepID=A0A5M6IHK9_9PROT|nr:DctP family TRAP transporter solute-binding subunit [Roseospira marina]KAA5607048.1 DctP family TRAP transporter solute-binding subunit [Roseospira marina]MBB4312764.1 tripartite ATP-independent transporter DctP family solute receptor [Roseospira marina]MBB5086463.1 tripartite ATP-independent transporter DctP family solute receptor [Roseospira marina]